MTRNNERPLALIILDGWGVAPPAENNALAAAHTPCYDEICAKYPSATLAAAGAEMGLGDGEKGNAEVGHRAIGAGRTVLTDAARVRAALTAGEFDRSPT